MSQDVLIIVAAIAIGFGAVMYLLKKELAAKNTPKDMEDMVNKVFGMSAQKVAEQSKQLLEGDRTAISVDLENKQRMLEKLVKDLKVDLSVRQDELRGLEKDRTTKFSQLTTQLEQQREEVKELRVSTQQLAKILSNNQTRGAWGERIIEDLLQANGLVEGVHYVKQTQLGNTALRPDITLLLPNSRVVAVDVKFPYSEIQKMAQAESESAKEAHLKQFGSDLRTKVKKVASYIDPEAQTLDYAIMFVPNEMIFSFINQKFSEIVDEAMSQRVIMVSPFTFIIVARTVLESYRNFMMEDRLRHVVTQVDGFLQEWTKFKTQFEKYGRAIDSLKISYDELMGTRVRQMEKRIEKIETTHQGSLAMTEKPTLKPGDDL